MKFLGRVFYLVFCCLVVPISQAAQQGYLAVTGRPGVTIPVWYIAPDHATDIVVLFSGGAGRVGITQKGIKHQGNFLVRTRSAFAKAGMIVAIPDKPSDRGDLFGFRTSQAHADDIRALMRFLRLR